MESRVVLVVKNLPANAGDTEDEGLIPGSGRSPGGGHGHPLQYSCLENPHGQRSLVGLQSGGLHRVRHDWSDLACTRGRVRDLLTEKRTMAMHLLELWNFLSMRKLECCFVGGRWRKNWLQRGGNKWWWIATFILNWTPLRDKDIWHLGIPFPSLWRHKTTPLFHLILVNGQVDC